ncbi:Outer membrane biogenesis protein BamB [Planctomycetales bacterium 10988]|nr:Outer membrane biogenesis protein BamB [Planctomycetales bacterium 10988]
MSNLLRCGLWLGCAFVMVSTIPASAERLEGQWPQWRGPNRDAIAPETGLADSWENQAPQLAWEADGLGSGYASLSLVDGKIYTMGDFDTEQCALCLEDGTGKVLWKTPVGPAGGIGYAGSRCTPTVDGNLLYVTGSSGTIVCLNAKTGKIVWQREMVDEFGGSVPKWGFAESPLVDGNLLLCTPGSPDATIVALNKKNGKGIWKSSVPDLGENGKDEAGYSSIVISEACGVKQYVQLTGKGVIGVDAKDGKFLWGYNRIANRVANIPTPLIDGDYVFTSTGYSTGAALLKIVKKGSKLEAEEMYFLPPNKMQNHHGGMVLLDGHVYCGTGHNEGFPLCVEMASGDISWFGGRGPGKKSAAVVAADGNLIFRYQDGVVALIEATPDEYRLKGTFQIPNVSDPSWPHPVVVEGKLFLREQDHLYVYDLKY